MIPRVRENSAVVIIYPIVTNVTFFDNFLAAKTSRGKLVGESKLPSWLSCLISVANSYGLGMFMVDIT